MYRFKKIGAVLITAVIVGGVAGGIFAQTKKSEEPIFCSAIYDPVCSTEGKTYGNDCSARSEGATVKVKGECPPLVCPTDSQPVCANGKEYINECEAKKAGVSEYEVGACRSVVVCPAGGTPVCGENGKTYTSACLAQKERTAVLHEGACSENRLCTMQYDPVCGVDGKTYSNLCTAGVVSVAHPGECRSSSACGPGGKAVCGMDGTTYVSECVMRTSGIELLHEGMCTSEHRSSLRNVLVRSGTTLWHVDEDGIVKHIVAEDEARSAVQNLVVPMDGMDLMRIPVALSKMSGKDRDKDGLSDAFEKALGTNASARDTDRDGHDDRTEIVSGFDPLKKKKKLPLDHVFATGMKWRFLQHRGNAAIWYVGIDGKRVFVESFLPASLLPLTVNVPVGEEVIFSDKN